MFVHHVGPVATVWEGRSAQHEGIGPKLKDKVHYVCKISQLLKFILFANDTNNLGCDQDLHQPLDKITSELSKIKTWFHISKLSLNQSKLSS